MYLIQEPNWFAVGFWPAVAVSVIYIVCDKFIKRKRKKQAELEMLPDYLHDNPGANEETC